MKGKKLHLILLAQLNDQAAQQVYGYAFNIYHTDAEGLARVSDFVVA